MKRLAAEAKDFTLLKYLTQQFSCIDKKHALQIIAELGEPFGPAMKARPRGLACSRALRAARSLMAAARRR